MKKTTKCRLRSCITLACTFALLGSTLSVQATDVQNLENQTSNLQNQLSDINTELVSISDEIRNLQWQVESVSGEIARTQADLADAHTKEDQQYADMKSRIKYMYETGDSSFLEMLCSAEDMTDFLNKADFIQNVSDYDRSMITELQNTQAAIAEEQQTLQTQQDYLIQVQNDATDKQAELERRAAETSTDLAAFNSQLSDARAAEAQRLAEEAAAQAAAAEAAAASGSGVQVDGSESGSVNVGSPISVDASELDVFAAILACEAYQQYDYMLAVATVIMNRVNSSAFPNTISGVVFAPGQFEPAMTGRLENALASGNTDLAYQVARDALNGARLASVSDCYYFLSSWTGHSGIDVGGNVFFQSW